MNAKKPILVIILFFLILFQAISGIFGGIGLIIDPSGETLQIPLEWLEGSPFKSYLIPGIILFIVLGVMPFLIFFGIRKRKLWGWQGSIFIGLALIIWIAVEIIIIGYQHDPPLQLIYGIVGIAILAVTNTASVKNFFRQTDKIQQ